MEVTDTAAFFADAEVRDPLRNELMDLIVDRYHATPRHQQVEAGPSDVAHPCMRKLAYKLMNEPRCNPAFDPLPSIIGTATHTWLQSAAEHANAQLGRERWLTETRVEVAPGLSGSCDLFDRDTGTVIDWKVLGYTSYDKYRNDPGPTYKAQVNLYGLGFARLGYNVNEVAVCILPRSGVLTKMVLWRAPFDHEIALAALRRRIQTMELLAQFDVENNPDRYTWFPVTPVDCLFCSQWSPKPKNGLQCQGGT